MELELLKDYKPHSRVLKAGTRLGVTNEKGLELIKKGIAKDVTIQVKAEIVKKREEETAEVEEIVKAVREADKVAEIKETAKEIKNKKNN